MKLKASHASNAKGIVTPYSKAISILNTIVRHDYPRAQMSKSTSTSPIPQPHSLKPSPTLKSCPIDWGKRIQRHVIKQVHTTNIDALRCLRNRLIANVLEKGSARRQIPHLIATIPVVAAIHVVTNVSTIGRAWSLTVRGTRKEVVLIIDNIEWCC